MTYGAEETLSFTTQIKGLSKEDGGNAEIPESDRHSSEYFDDEQTDSAQELRTESSKMMASA